MAHKLSKYLPEIKEAMYGNTDLRKDQKIYKKVHKYYKDLGVTFSGDSESDYDLLLDCLEEDIY